MKSPGSLWKPRSVFGLRAVVRLRKQDVDERKEQEAILETYLQALGMLN